MMNMKTKLYLQILLLINYMMEGNMFVNVDNLLQSIQLYYSLSEKISQNK